MKHLTLLLIFLSITGCNFKATNTSASLKAVYFVQGKSELSLEDLQAYPEIVVVQTFDEFKKYAQQKVALWIDKSATPFTPEQEQWINETPQAYYPIVIVGTSDTLYSFRDLLRLCCFQGPAGNYPGYNTPGFSVIQRQKPSDPAAAPIDITFLQGFNQKPTVQAILEITNVLLEGRWKPTPTVLFIPPATATMVP